MRITNCNVCGLPTKACLHQKELRYYRKEKNVSRLLWFTIGFLLAFFLFLMSSCSTDRFVTTYKIKTDERNYYVNHFKVVNDTIYCAELKRNGTIRQVYALPYSSSEIQVTK